MAKAAGQVATIVIGGGLQSDSDEQSLIWFHFFCCLNMSTIIGAVVLSRHGDRSPFYRKLSLHLTRSREELNVFAESPYDYDTEDTTITPLGEQQEFQLGSLLRSMYLSDDSPSFIQDLGTSLVNKSRISFLADAGGEGSVILDSAVALAQGMWPADSSRSITLANGTEVTSPLGGYQYIGVESVEPEQSVALEGWTSCSAFNDANIQLHQSDEWKQKEEEVAPFLDSLKPIVSGRQVTLDNFYNVFDFINVQSIHNSTFLESVDEDVLERTRDLVNWHQFNTFSSSDLSSITNVAGQAILATIFSNLKTISDKEQPLRFTQISISYKPFISLTRMLGITQSHPDLRGMITYASSMTFELYQPDSGDDPLVRFGLKNGTEEESYTFYNLLDRDDVSLNELQSFVQPYVLPDLSSWCHACQNTESRGCDTIAAANETWSNNDVASGQTLSPLAAGFIGASVTLAILVALFAGFLATQSKKQKRARAISLRATVVDQSPGSSINGKSGTE